VAVFSEVRYYWVCYWKVSQKALDFGTYRSLALNFKFFVRVMEIKKRRKIPRVVQVSRLVSKKTDKRDKGENKIEQIDKA
jgi:hypothetical protein